VTVILAGGAVLLVLLVLIVLGVLLLATRDRGPRDGKG
jgi:hypothetical protein